MPIYIKDGTYKPAVKIWQKVGGVWVVTPQWWFRHGGQYKLIHTTRNPFYFNVTLPNTVNFNLRDACIAAGWNQTDYVIANITIPVGVTVSSASVGMYAFSTGISFPPDSKCTVTLDGVISGRGGNGGSSSVEAQPGGPGMFSALPLVLLGSGSLQAGGGGGGAGGSVAARLSGVAVPSAFEGGAGGSGGGAGQVGGVGGAGGPTYGSQLGDWFVRRGTGAPASAGGETWGYSGANTAVLIGGTGGVGGLGSAGFAGGVAQYYLVSGTYLHSLIPPRQGAPGGSAYAGIVNTDSFTGTIIGYRG